MRSRKPLTLVLIAAAGALAAGLAQARDHADVQWSVTIGSTSHLPVYAPAPVVVRPAPRMVVYPAPMPVRYREPTRWDRDGDGVPDRHDRLYNPRWDVDGDGIPNRHDRHYTRYHDGRGHDRDRDGIPNHRDPYPNQPARGWGGH